MEFVLSRDAGWIRVQWDIPISELLEKTQSYFQKIKKQVEMTTQATEQLVNALSKYGPKS